ncbi:twin-arginine translocase TatA/TatE family subunit [Nocardioides sp. TRM66260-LWL]|uniref:twin-arginine translocase TatA/TatE family subunit n=1 Tax=Nocardioides sp. TRM66260-LWL TaxID=2874478 RepID=UPI001CC50B33|nr:twin-arginine translocase TatA/TatE family subunit [Nocardioides sp. TRM66260-LWL]MBZ5734098.1 twin-arginine translocase TatA/TatE family subunit [Nocardioides sp. TRM66260-LWL]
MTPLLMMPEGAEWLVILAIVVLVFGASKLPDLARSSGQALRIFKAEAKALREDDAPARPIGTPDPRIADSGTPGV